MGTINIQEIAFERGQTKNGLRAIYFLLLHFCYCRIQRSLNRNREKARGRKNGKVSCAIGKQKLKTLKWSHNDRSFRSVSLALVHIDDGKSNCLFLCSVYLRVSCAQSQWNLVVFSRLNLFFSSTFSFSLLFLGLFLSIVPSNSNRNATT